MLRDAANELVSHCVAVVVVGDRHDICSAQLSQLVNACVGSERSLEKSTSIQERTESVFRNIDICIMCEYPHAQVGGPKNILKAFFHKCLDATFFKLYFAFSLVIFIVHQPLFLMSYLKKTPCP